MKKLLIIVGSLRNNSFNQQLADKLKHILKGKAEIGFLEYGDLPFLNQDKLCPVPESVERVRREVKQADGVWIFTPEYNYSFPGVLKNLLDWLSCPADPKDRKSASVACGKSVTLSSVAGKSAGVGVRKNLCQLLKAMSMTVVFGEGSGYVLDSEAFRSGVLNVCPQDLEKLEVQAEEFLKAI